MSEPTTSTQPAVESPPAQLGPAQRSRLSFGHPSGAPCPVLEQGCEVCVSLFYTPGDPPLSAVSLLLVDTRAYTWYWAETVLVARHVLHAAGGHDAACVRVLLRVPREQPPGASYNLVVRGLPAGAADDASLPVRVAPPRPALRTQRVGPASLEASWPPALLPPSPSPSGWRLCLDVTPVLEAGEDESVVGDVFCAAAAAGLFVHTLDGRRLLFDVAPGEAAACCKRVPLLPRRTYHVALLGFPSDSQWAGEAAWSTPRVECRLGFLILSLAGGGLASGERRVRLGDGLFARSAAPPPPPPQAPAAAAQQQQQPAQPATAQKESAAPGGASSPPVVVASAVARARPPLPPLAASGEFGRPAGGGPASELASFDSAAGHSGAGNPLWGALGSLSPNIPKSSLV